MTQQPIPLRHLAKRMLSREQAACGCLLYTVCAQVIRFGITAQLKFAKFFLGLCFIERCISGCEQFSLKRPPSTATAFALLALCRTEGLFYGVFCVVAVLSAAISSLMGRAVQTGRSFMENAQCPLARVSILKEGSYFLLCQ
jgi:hypothetical protein